jgi:hypothetical protein
MAFYRCWNTACPNYAPGGVRLGEQHIQRINNVAFCPACGHAVEREETEQGEDAVKGVAGAAGGALLGWAIGGPPGALVGGILGLIVTAASGSKDK